MRVIGWSPHLTKARAEAAGVEFIESKQELFAQSDIVSVHMVLSETTKGLVAAQDLANMKPTAFFINTSRGPLVDENALVEVLEERKIAGAGLDVFDVEPLPLDHPLRKLENVVITPHMGYVSDFTYEVVQALVLYLMTFLHPCRHSGRTQWITLTRSWTASPRTLLRGENINKGPAGIRFCSKNQNMYNILYGFGRQPRLGHAPLR